MSWLPDDFAHPVRIPVPGIGIHLRPIREADTAIDYPAVTIRPPGPARSSQSGMQLQLVQHLRTGDPDPHPPSSRTLCTTAHSPQPWRKRRSTHYERLDR
jgi:hypothetical protein